MILSHYLQIVWHYRKISAILFFSVTLGVASLGTVLLYATPIYTGIAKVSLLPTESELAFTRTFVQSSQFSPANMISQTHIENLISRPVAEGAIKRLLDTFGAPETSDVGGLVDRVRRGLQGAKRAIRRVYNILNSGRHVPLDPYTDAILTLQDSVEVEMVEGTYILEISVSWDDPRIAAAAANILAEAYVDRVREQTVAASDALEAWLEDEVDTNTRRLAGLQRAEAELKRELGIVDVAQERQSLLVSRETERSRLTDSETELRAYDERMRTMAEGRETLRLAGRESVLTDSLALYDATRADLLTRIAARSDKIEAIDKALEGLNEDESKLDGLRIQRQAVADEVAKLKDRGFALRLARTDGLSNLRMIEPATPPFYPSFPKVVLYTILATVGALALVAFVVVALDTLTDSVKTTADLQRLFGERALGVVSVGRASRRGLPAAVAKEIARRLRLRSVADPAVGAVVALGDDADGETAARALGSALGEAPRSLGGATGGFDLSKLALAPSWVVLAGRTGEVSEAEFIGAADEVARRGGATVFALLLRS